MAKVCWGAKLAWPRPAPCRVQQHRHRRSQLLATARSGRPSPLRSPTATEQGLDAGGEGLLGAKRGVAATAPSCSAAPTPCHWVRIGDGEVGPAVAVEVPHRHGEGTGAGGEGLLGGEGGRSRPRRRCVQQHRHRVRAFVGDDEVGPAVAVEVAEGYGKGVSPAAKLCWAANEGVRAPGSVVLNSTEIVCGWPLATARSGRPSPLRSATATKYVFSVNCEALRSGEGGHRRPRGSGIQEHPNGLSEIHDSEIGPAIAIEVTDRDAD